MGNGALPRERYPRPGWYDPGILKGAPPLTTPPGPDQARIKAAVTELLSAIGEDPSREGLLETPRRIAEMYSDIFDGLFNDPKEHLGVVFSVAHDELVLLRNIPFYSMCEHHFLPFHGEAHVGYIPDGRVVGISKLARVVEAYARRFQVQEKLTAQIAHCIHDVLHPRGVGVVIEAAHQCMTTRGVHKTGVSMVTSQMLGSFREDARTRDEFLRLVGL